MSVLRAVRLRVSTNTLVYQSLTGELGAAPGAIDNRPLQLTDRRTRASKRRYCYGSSNSAPAVRQRRSLRAPDPPLESKDEEIHLDRPLWYLHH